MVGPPSKLNFSARSYEAHDAHRWVLRRFYFVRRNTHIGILTHLLVVSSDGNLLQSQNLKRPFLNNNNTPRDWHSGLSANTSIDYRIMIWSSLIVNCSVDTERYFGKGHYSVYVRYNIVHITKAGMVPEPLCRNGSKSRSIARETSLPSAGGAGPGVLSHRPNPISS